jgi:hypothetical protein
MSNPLLVKNYVADVAIPAFRMVKPGTTTDRITLAAGSGDAMIGTTMDIAAAPGERCDVQMIGIAFVEAGANFGRGVLLTSDADGRAVVASMGPGLNANIAGRALEASVAAGDVIRMIQSIGQIQG